jgi:hypothetical protein
MQCMQINFWEFDVYSYLLKKQLNEVNLVWLLFDWKYSGFILKSPEAYLGSNLNLKVQSFVKKI